MHWHADPITLTLRGYADEAGSSGRACFAKSVPYQVVATVQLLGGGKCNILGLKGDGNMPLKKRDYRGLLDLLRDEHGIRQVLSIRHGADADFDTTPAPPD